MAEPDSVESLLADVRAARAAEEPLDTADLEATQRELEEETAAAISAYESRQTAEPPAAEPLFPEAAPSESAAESAESSVEPAAPADELGFPPEQPAPQPAPELASGNGNGQRPSDNYQHFRPAPSSTDEAPRSRLTLHNEEAEVAILGAILQDPQALRSVLDIVRPADFYLEAHQRILEAVIALTERGESADLITLTEELRAHGQLERCRGAAYIASLTSAIPTSANVEFYARIVQECSQKRAFDAMLRQALEENSSPTSPAVEIFARVSRQLSNLISSSAGPRMQSVGDVFAYPDPAWGIEKLFEKYSLNLCSALSGIGKTLIGYEIVRSYLDGFPAFGCPFFHVREQGPVILIDEESPRPVLKNRLQKMKFREGMPLSILHFAGLRIDEDAGFAAIQKLIEAQKPVLVVFDSLIRMHSAEENSSTEMARVMRRFRILSNLTTVLLIHHSGKAEMDMRRLSRGSGDIVAAVDQELVLTRAGEELILQSAKTRGIPLAPIRLKIMADDGQLGVRYLGQVEPERDQVSAAIREAITGRAMGIMEIVSELAAAGLDVSRSTVRRVLFEDLKGNVQIEVGERGKKVYSLSTCPGVQEVST